MMMDQGRVRFTKYVRSVWIPAADLYNEDSMTRSLHQACATKSHWARAETVVAEGLLR